MVAQGHSACLVSVLPWAQGPIAKKKGKKKSKISQQNV